MKTQLSLFAGLALCLFWSANGLGDSRIINGVEVPPGLFTEVVAIKSDGASCTATVVGPRALLTAAHCARSGGSVEFKVGGRSYVGRAIRHPNYPREDVDVVLVITAGPIAGVVPASVGSTVQVGQAVFLLGHGCTQPGGGGGNDGKIRMGASVITDFTKYDFVTEAPNGGALCFGDSGGPTLAKEGEQFRVVGINSKGNISDTNYSLYLAGTEVRKFLSEEADKNQVEICGVTASCADTHPGKPQFKKALHSFRIPAATLFSQTLGALLTHADPGVKFFLDSDAPDWMTLQWDSLVLDPPAGVQGSFVVTLTAKGQLGADATLVQVEVSGPPAQAPACALTASPAFIRLGETTTLEMRTVGEVSTAQIDGADVSATGGTRVITPTASGVYFVKGSVTGPAGSGTCSVRYGVK